MQAKNRLASQENRWDSVHSVSEPLLSEPGFELPDAEIYTVLCDGRVLGHTLSSEEAQKKMRELADAKALEIDHLTNLAWIEEEVGRLRIYSQNCCLFWMYDRLEHTFEIQPSSLFGGSPV